MEGTGPRTKKVWRGLLLGVVMFIVYFVVSQFIGLLVPLVHSTMYFVQEGIDPQSLSSSSELFERGAEIESTIPGFGTAAIIGLLVGWLAAIGAIALVYKIVKINKIKRPVRASLELGKVKPLTIVLAVGAGIGLITFGNAAMSLLPIPEAMQEEFGNAFSWTESTPQALLLLGIGVVGPIAEEIGLRSGVFGVVRRDLGFWPAALISSALFGLMHMVPLQICYATLYGLFLAATFQAAKSVWPCIVIHIVNNSYGFVMPPSTLESVQSFLLGGPQAWVTMIIGAVLLAVTLFFMTRQQKGSTWQVSYD